MIAEGMEERGNYPRAPGLRHYLTQLPIRRPLPKKLDRADQTEVRPAFWVEL